MANQPSDQLLEILQFYADPNNYQNGVPGERSLFGYEPDNGTRAKAGIALLERIVQAQERLKAKIDKDASQSPPRFVAGDSSLNLLMRTWTCTQRYPLFGAAWQGYLSYGKGILLLTHRWFIDASNPKDELRFEQMSRYLSERVIREQIPEPFQAESLRLIQEYDPTVEVVLGFCGHDLSQQGKRLRFSLERNYFQFEIVRVGEAESVPAIAGMMGIEQPAIQEESIEIFEEIECSGLIQ